MHVLDYTYHTIGTVLKSNSKTIERDKTDIIITCKYMTAQKNAGVKLLLSAQLLL